MPESAVCVSTRSTAAQERELVNELTTPLRDASGPVKGGFVYCGVGYDTRAIALALQEALPDVPFVGVTSFQTKGAVALWLCGERVRFGVAHLEKTANVTQTLGHALAERARTSGRLERVNAAVLHSTPGGEEVIVHGLHGALPPRTAVIGGSAADDDLSGKWRVFSSELGPGDNAAVVALLDWPGPVTSAYQGGAVITSRRGIVTRARGRTIEQIDHRPAAEVYDAWLGGKLSAALVSGGSVLPDTTLTPLGVFRGVSGQLGTYVLVHPERITPDKGLTVFAEVAEGEEVIAMTSSKLGLIGRAGSLAGRALQDARMSPAQVAGALLVYCAGCKLSIGDQSGTMLKGFEAAVGAPFAAVFCYGEQGCATPERADHGNLMTSVLLLGRPA
ncbi:MAG: FIST C-terminal domain-containing protein [Myxococcaceae bacterium]